MKARDKKMSITSTVIYIIGLFLVSFTTAMLVYKHDAEMLHNYRERIMELLSIHAKNLLEKAEIEKNSFTLEQINAGLMADNARLTADNARLTAERDAAKTQQVEPEIVENAAEPERGDLLPLPAAPTNVISMESYNIFVKNSEQAMLQDACFTDDYFQGVRYYLHDGTKAYCAALSTNYADEIGTVLEVTLCNGVSFNVICADFKNPLGDPRTDWYGSPCRNYSDQKAVCVIEFVVNMERIPSSVRIAGTFTAMPELGGLYGEGGNIKEIRKVGRWWKP